MNKHLEYFRAIFYFWDATGGDFIIENCYEFSPAKSSEKTPKKENLHLC